MFRASIGFTAQYQDLTLTVAPDFDEWRILLQGPGVVINGGRQFAEGKAKDYARNIADCYIREERHQEPAPVAELQWTPMEPRAWLNYRT
ncbi:MAG TPA: hypothetical protein VE959_22195 [Bryobacteraceae bacterium]|nr:hypothetical protein [Bryobacteraceae bacterium]